MATIRKPVTISKPTTITPSIKKTTTASITNKVSKAEILTKKPQTTPLKSILPMIKTTSKTLVVKLPSTKVIIEKPTTNKSLIKPDAGTSTIKASTSQPAVVKRVADSTSSVKESKTIKKSAALSPATSKTAPINGKPATVSKPVTSVDSKLKTSHSVTKTVTATKQSITSRTVQPTDRPKLTATNAKLVKATDTKLLPKISQSKTIKTVSSVSKISSKSVVSNSATLLKKSAVGLPNKNEIKKPLLGTTKLIGSPIKTPVKSRAVKSPAEQVKNVTKVCTNVQICDADSTSPTISSEPEIESAWTEEPVTESTNFNEIQAYKVAEQIIEVMNTISGSSNDAEQNSFMKDSVVIDMHTVEDNADAFSLTSRTENVDDDDRQINKLNDEIDEERQEITDRSSEQIESESNASKDTQIVEDLESENTTLENLEVNSSEEIIHENSENKDAQEAEAENTTSEEQIAQITTEEGQDSDELVESENQPAGETEAEELSVNEVEIYEENLIQETFETTENYTTTLDEKYNNEDSTKENDEDDVAEAQKIDSENEIIDENSCEKSDEPVNEVCENFENTSVKDDTEIRENKSEVVPESEELENVEEKTDEDVDDKVQNLDEKINSTEEEVDEEHNEAETSVNISEESFPMDDPEITQGNNDNTHPQTEAILIEENYDQEIENTILENKEDCSIQMQENYFGDNSKTIEFEFTDNECNSDGFIDLKSDEENAEKAVDNESIASTDSASYAEVVKQSSQIELLVDYFENELEKIVCDDKETTEIVTDEELQQSVVADADTNLSVSVVNEELRSECEHPLDEMSNDRTERTENVFEEFTEEAQPEMDANIEEHPSIDVEGYEKVQKKRNKRHNKRNRKSFRSFKNENTDQDTLAEIKENFGDDQTFFKRRNSRRNRHSMKKHYRRNSEPYHEPQYYTVPVWRSFYHEY